MGAGPRRAGRGGRGRGGVGPLAGLARVAALSAAACVPISSQNMDGQGIVAGSAQGPGDAAGAAGAGTGTASSARTPLVADHIPAESPCTSDQPAPRTLRRLTRGEFVATTQAMLGAADTVPTPTDLFAEEPEAYGFSNIQYNLAITDTSAPTVQAAAEQAAAYAAGKAAALAGCGTADATCIGSFVAKLGKAAFRRPLSPAEVADYVALVPSGADLPGAMQAVVAGLMQSPFFLYRSELGQPAGAQGTFALTPYEVASQLSYLFVGGPPDPTLMQAADAGALASAQQLATQAARLLADSRAKAQVVSFFSQWLDVADLVRQVHTEHDGVTLDEPTKTALLGETQAFIEDLVFAKNGSYHDLLAAQYSFVNTKVATFYNLPGTFTDKYQQTPWSGGMRLPGVLGQGAWLAAASSSIEASPVYRGRALRMRFLCQPIGSPPSNVPQITETSSTPQTLRDRFEAHITNDVCSVCHNLMDPMAYPLGDFDGLGRHRAGDTEAGQPVVLTGKVNSPLVGDPVELADGQALAAYLAGSSQAQACLSRHWSMYALGQLTWPQDGCTFAAAAKFAASSGYNLQQVLVGITQTPSFTTRVQDS